MADPGDNDGPVGALGWLKRVWNAEGGFIAFVREIVSAVAIVVLVGGILFGVSGVWPPMVAIESPSMEPHINTGDLVFVTEEHRFSGDNAVTVDGSSTGVVPFQVAKEDEYKTFSSYGDVIIYEPDGNEFETPIIHRARFWVDSGENWYDKANKDYLNGAQNCQELANCPAPHAGFITKGDNKVENDRYDQVAGLSEPVKPSWIIGTAKFRIPYLGEIRLLLKTITAGPIGTTPAQIGGGAGLVAP